MLNDHVISIYKMYTGGLYIFQVTRVSAVWTDPGEKPSNHAFLRAFALA